MVGVLNGSAKKAFTAGFVVAVCLCGVFGGLVTQPCLAEVGDTGSFGGTGTTTNLVTVTDGFYCAPYALPVDANVTSLHVYMNLWTSDTRLFIYSLDGLTCYYGSDAVSSGDGDVWINVTGVDTLLEAGTYLLGVRTKVAGQSLHYVVGNGMNGSVAYNGAWSSLSMTYNAYQVSVYANYTEANIEGGELELSMGISSWGGLAVSVFLIAVCLVLALKSRSWAVNFLFGLGTVGFLGWVFANATVEVYGGWLMYMVLLSAVLALTKGAVLVRSSGV